MMKKKKTRRILYLGERRNSVIVNLLRRAHFEVITLYTIDHGVAYAAHNSVDFVILDHGSFVEVEGWSPAQSFKLVRPSMCVVLISDSKKFGAGLPADVDAMVSSRSNRALAAAVKRLITGAKTTAA